MASEKRHKEYYKNTGILLIGKFATQFSSLLLIPIFTQRLATADYGYVDLIQTYISLFVPILILRFDSAVFRFLIDERQKNNQEHAGTIIVTSLATMSILAMFTILIGIILISVTPIHYGLLAILNIVCLMYSNILLQIARGLGHTMQYSIASALMALATIVINLILIIFFNFGASSIFISSIVANIIGISYIVLAGGIMNNLRLKLYDRHMLKDMLRYSLPMIPNSLSWWIINVSDRTVITVVLGNALNGIYAVSCKFSNIINSVFSIFNMSWQETAAVHINDPDRDAFFTSMVNKLLISFTSLSVLIMSAISVFFNFFIGQDYAMAYDYIPMLLFANIFNIAVQLFGAVYIAKKKTRPIMNTTIASAVINLLVDLALIHFVGLYAACISTLAANLVLAVYRYFDIQKYVRIKISLRMALISLFAFGLCALVYFMEISYISALGFCSSLVFTVLANKDFLVDIKRWILRRNSR